MSLNRSSSSEVLQGDPDARLLAALKFAVRSLDVPAMCIALVDEQGELTLFHRMEGAPRRCIAIAIAKAYTAIRLGGPTRPFQQKLIRDRLSQGDFCDPRLTSLPGGEVVKDESGQIRLGVGVSGGTVTQDTLAIEHLISVVKGWLAWGLSIDDRPICLN